MRALQIKTAPRLHRILLRTAKINKTTDNKCWYGFGKRGTLIHCWWGCKLMQSFWKLKFYNYFRYKSSECKGLEAEAKLSSVSGGGLRDQTAVMWKPRLEVSLARAVQCSSETLIKRSQRNTNKTHKSMKARTRAEVINWRRHHSSYCNKTNTTAKSPK